jgi:hypothetical protein
MTTGRYPPGSWMDRLEAKHGKPLEDIDATVYVIHYAAPTLVRSVSNDYGPGISVRPVTHYVGWTQQARPMNRVRNHHDPGTEFRVDFQPGTMRDETRLKAYGRCFDCGEALADSLVPDAVAYYRAEIGES